MDDPNNLLACVVCGVGGRDVTLSNRKVCTTCAQKFETYG